MPVLTGASAPGPLVLRGGGRARADSGVHPEPPRPCTDHTVLRCASSRGCSGATLADLVSPGAFF